jgi:SAM-dependent methyltransferase
MRADSAFTGSIPELYERYLGPLFFVPYAADFVQRAKALDARRILEVAAGTGVVTRAVIDAVPSAEIEATDINEAMVKFATERNTSHRVRWSVADAMSLPFDDDQFDLVVCQFGVMFFPDRERAFREARRVLRPGGTYLFNVWDDLEHNPVPRIVAETVERAFPDDPPSFIRRVPHGHGDMHGIARDLRAVEFRAIESETVELPCRASSAAGPATGICKGTPFRHEIASRDPLRLDELTEQAAQALRSAFGGDAINSTMRAFVFSAVA